MRITNLADRQALVDWSTQILQTVGSVKDGVAAQEINQAVTSLLADMFCITVMGKAKRGKSTLLNALLGCRDDTVAPVDKLPASSTISRFRWADSEQATVVFRDGRREPITYARIRDFVTEEHNKENHKGVDIVEIEGPFTGIESDLELIDTPGAGSIHEHHDALLHAFIPQSDAVIFLVTARMPLDQDELDLLERVKAADIRKVFFAVNRVDECFDQDVDDAVSHNMRLLESHGIQVGKIYRISAKTAFREDAGCCGVQELMRDIAGFMAANKGRVIVDRFVSRIRNTIKPISQSMDVKLACSRKGTDELDAELASLQQQKRTIETEQVFSEREFMNAWTSASDTYGRELNSAKQEVLDCVASLIQDSSLFEVSQLAKQLPTKITHSIESALHPVACRFEESARDACDRLQANYPELQAGEAGTVLIRTREGMAAISGTVGGVAVATAGTGLAAAGATAAAGITAANIAADAATTTVAAPSVVSGVLTLIGYEVFAPLATGTATLAAPIAATATPLWVALAGPVGWTIAGIGALAIPFSWRISKVKLRDSLDAVSEQQIMKVFNHLTKDRLSAIRTMGKTIQEGFKLQLDRQLSQVEAAMIDARDNRPSETEIAQLSEQASKLRGLLERYAT